MTTQDTTTQGTTTQGTTTGSAGETNVSTVRRVLGVVFGAGDVGALEPVLDKSFVHHRPDGTSRGRDEWVAAVRQTVAEARGVQVDVRHLLADGDHVVMHSVRRLPGGPAVTGVDIWRFDRGRVAEAWEILEPAAEAAGHLRWWEPAGR
ncbi:nuclear transport factor 2 family protein [Isoptericola cucumis]|nr:nuclear transport factor 2 family protein [Isoptericola cucumis]